MKILVITKYNEIIDVVNRMYEEGNEINLFITDKKYYKYGFLNDDIKILEKIDDYKKYDLIIFDDNCWTDVPIKVRSLGIKTIGGSYFTEKLENNREFFYRNCQLVGIKTPKTFKFSNFNDVIKHIKKYPKEYVLKSSSDNKSLTVVSKDVYSRDIIDYIKLNNQDIKTYFLQEKVKGYEVAVSGFFDGEKFLQIMIVNYEHKKFGNNNTGVFTGEMGTVLVWYPYIKSKIYTETLEKFVPLLKDRFVGIFDLNMIVNTSGCYVLEPTPRFGYPITDIMSSNIYSWSKLLYSLAEKNDTGVIDNIINKKCSSCGVVLTAISPLEEKNCLIGIKYNLFKKYRKNFSVYGIYKDVIIDSYIGVVHNIGNNIEQAIQNCYAIIKEVDTPSLFYYRTDIGQQSVVAHKWLSGLKYFDKI